MRKIFITSFILASISLQAQTKKIAFKSHSGSAENFATALADNLFDMENSDFGAAPERTIRTAQLDSVIYVSDSISYLVTTTWCTEWRSRKKDDDSTLWYPGRQMVFKHPLFSKKHSLDSIKNVIKQNYYFKNPVEKVVFIGFDNEPPVDTIWVEMEEPITYQNTRTKAGLLDTQTIIVCMIIAGISLLASWFNRKSSHQA